VLPEHIAFLTVLAPGRLIYKLPGGPIGRGARLALRVLGGALNRCGLMHTRAIFDPAHPLRCEVDGLTSDVPLRQEAGGDDANGSGTGATAAGPTPRSRGA